MVFKINGLEITPYIAFGGLAWQRSDVDGPNAGREQDGTLVRDRIAIKYRWDVTCRPLTGAELSAILKAIEPEWVTLEYEDPVTATVKTAQFYSNNIPATFAIKRRNGTVVWSGVTFPLIMK